MIGWRDEVHGQCRVIHKRTSRRGDLHRDHVFIGKNPDPASPSHPRRPLDWKRRSLQGRSARARASPKTPSPSRSHAISKTVRVGCRSGRSTERDRLSLIDHVNARNGIRADESGSSLEVFINNRGHGAFGNQRDAAVWEDRGTDDVVQRHRGRRTGCRHRHTAACPCLVRHPNWTEVRTADWHRSTCAVSSPLPSRTVESIRRHFRSESPSSDEADRHRHQYRCQSCGWVVRRTTVT